ncbi:LysE family transporter [Candidatus Berkiella aquae]|uniref:LysE family transporter n=1 Tax=Candidatus Berkiella aquae TaxID=295108 RepID=A0AAE3HSI7_9GAMM|nr:LysE family transporter [Candidatus Berkiella aquae]
MLLLFLKGFIIGFSIAAPVGPIGILCINRTLKAGIAAGLLSGLGAAFADAFYGCIAGAGFVAVSTLLLRYEILIRILGGLFLGYLGLKIFFSPHKPNAPQDAAKSLWQDFFSTFLLTITNPATILSFLAIYSGLGIIQNGAHFQEASLIVLGVFMGSLLWWVILCGGIHLVHHKLPESAMQWLNRTSGFILILFGLFALISLK